MPIQYQSVKEILEKLDIEYPDFKVCSSNSQNFSLLRAQMEAVFKYSEEEGPKVVTPQHDKKCWNTIKLAKKRNVDLLVFPEYCLSYDSIDNIVNDLDSWPEPNKLWCLPCQGIEYEDFEDAMDAFKRDRVIIINEAYKEEKRERKEFVNALIYCFSVYRGGEKNLILIPQLKTEAMRDAEYLCEGRGMSKGTLIYLFDGDRGNALLSLLCADALNSQITWDKISESGKSMIILHPQLNTSPKNNTFARLRNDMFERNQRHIYVSCNWAEGTRLVAPDNPPLIIETSWSCIYYKFQDTYDMKRWIEQSKQKRDENYSKLLLKGFISNRKVAVWYTLSRELIQEIIIEKVATITPAVTATGNKVLAKKLYLFEGENLTQKNNEKYSFEWCLSQLDQEVKEVIRELEPAYRFMLECEKKYDVDRFMEMCLAKRENESFRIDEREDLHCLSICMDKEHGQRIKDEIYRLIILINQLSNGKLPDHLVEYIENHKLDYKELNDGEIVNLISSQDKGIVVAIAKYKSEALNYANILKGQYRLEESQMPYKMCIYYSDYAKGTLECLPQVDKRITSGNQTYESTNIVNGGE